MHTNGTTGNLKVNINGQNINFSQKEKNIETENSYTCKDFLNWLFKNLKESDFIEISNNCKYSDYAKSVESAILIARNFGNKNIYFGVNPRFRIPDRKSKRANSKDVLKCIAVFLDFDFKSEVQSVPKEIEDELNKKSYVYYENILYVKDTEKNKIIQITKPSYDEFLRLITDKINQIGLTEEYLTIVDSGFGYHVYIRFKSPVKPEKWKELQDMLITFFKKFSEFEPDEKVKNPDRLMRLPDSVNARYEHVGLLKQCKVLKIASKEITFNDLFERLKAVLREDKNEKLSLNKKEEKVYVEIDDKEISYKAEEIAEALDSVYLTGHRNQIITGLAGLLRKAGWSEKEAVKLVEELCKILKDEELKNRIDSVKSTFKKKPNEVSYKMMIETITKVLDLKKVPDAKNRAYKIFWKIAEIVGYSNIKVTIKESKRIKGSNIVVIRTYYENGKNIGIRKSDDTGNKVYISDYYVANVTEYIVHNFADNTCETRYDVIFKNRFTNEEKKYLFLPLDEILEKAKKDEIPKVSNIFKDAVKTIIQKFRELGRVEVKKTANAIGFFELDGKLRFIIPPDREKIIQLPHEVAVDKINEALYVLTEIIKFYDDSEMIKAIICTGFIAPFGFIRKLHGIEQKYKILYGSPHTGKTWLCKVIASIWGDIRYNLKKSGQSSIPQIGDFIASTTLPIYFDEAKTMLENDKVIEILKDATLNLTCREIIVNPITRDKKTFPAYASVYFTMNMLPEKARGTEAFIEERCYLFHFDVNMKKETGKEFWRRMSKEIKKLPAIGGFIRTMIDVIYDVQSERERLIEDVKNIIFSDNHEEWEVGRQLLLKLIEVYNNYLGSECNKIIVPEWLQHEIKYDYKKVISEEKVDFVEEWLSWFTQKINRMYVSLIKDRERDATTSFIDKITDLLKTGEIDWFSISRNTEYIYFTQKCFRLFRCERGYECEEKLSFWRKELQRYISDVNVKTTRIRGKEYKVICLPINKFMKLIEPSEEEKSGVKISLLLDE